MLGFYSIDITIDRDGQPYLIEVNGSNSGFDGFLIAYGDTAIQDAIASAFSALIGNREVFVVTRLVNFGELPKGYLDKLVQDLLYFKSVENVHANLRRGVVGITWARMRTDRPPSTLGAGTSLDALIQRDPRFKKVVLNVTDPEYVIYDDCFRNDIVDGVLSFKEDLTGIVEARRLGQDDVLWLRCPTLAFAEPMTKGIHVNPEFPYDAIANNKLFTYDVMLKVLPKSLPAFIPVGNRCSGSAALEEFLACSDSSLFIRKPLAGSQARGIEILRRQDVEDYAARIRQLEASDALDAQELPLELRGVPELLATWTLRFDISLLGELALSKPVSCRQTGRRHYGCMRTIALLRESGNGHVEVEFLGAYWRLAPVPVDGDGMLWERFIGSQSQGAFCERVDPADMAIAEAFAGKVLMAYCRHLSQMPRTRRDYAEWEKAYWLARYREQVPLLSHEKPWSIFLEGVTRAEREACETKERAEMAGFRRVPSAVLAKEQIVRSRLPYLIRDPHRIIVR